MSTSTLTDYTVPGTTLPNHAVVITAAVSHPGKPGERITVLAMVHTDYVTWTLDPTNGMCYSGHYFSWKYDSHGFEKAVEDLKYRANN